MSDCADYKCPFNSNGECLRPWECSYKVVKKKDEDK